MDDKSLFLTIFLFSNICFSMGTDTSELKMVLTQQIDQLDQEDLTQNFVRKKVKRKPASLYVQSLIAIVKNNIDPQDLLPEPIKTDYEVLKNELNDFSLIDDPATLKFNLVQSILLVSSKNSNKFTTQLIRAGANVNLNPLDEDARVNWKKRGILIINKNCSKSLLAWALIDNEDSKALELIKNGANVNAKVNVLKHSALIYCAINPQKNHLSYALLDYGADCTAYNDKDSPLESCFRGNNLSLAKEIIKRGEIVFHAEKYDNTKLLVQAAAHNSVEAIQFLLGYQKQKVIFDNHSIIESNELINALIKTDNVDLLIALNQVLSVLKSENNLNNGLLLWIMKKKSKSKLVGKNNLLKYLLKQPGIELSNKYDDSWNPFIYALQTQDAALIDSFLTADPEIAHIKFCYMYPLEYVLKKIKPSMSIDAIKVLLEHGAAITFDKNTALHIAIAQKNTELVQLLLANNKDLINAEDKQTDETPLFIAIEQGNKKMVQLLLEQGASIDHMNRSGNTPIMLARLMGNIEIEKMLMDYKMKQM